MQEEKHAGWKHPGRRSSDYSVSYSHDHDRRNYAATDYAGFGPQGYNRDQRILSEVCESLKWNPEVDARGIEVHVREHFVYLDGWVDSRHAKKIAEKLAEDVFGVIDIYNNLTIRPVFDLNSDKIVTRGDDGLFTAETFKEH